MDVRYYIDPETERPHIYGHGVAERDGEGGDGRPMEDRPQQDGARVALGRTEAGRYLRVSTCLTLSRTPSSSSQLTHLDPRR